MRFSPRIMPNTGYLPQHFHTGHTAGNIEMIGGNLFCNIKIRSGVHQSRLPTPAHPLAELTNHKNGQEQSPTIVIIIQSLGHDIHPKIERFVPNLFNIGDGLELSRQHELTELPRKKSNRKDGLRKKSPTIGVGAENHESLVYRKTGMVIRSKYGSGPCHVMQRMVAPDH